MKNPKHLSKQILLTSLTCFSLGLTGNLAAETSYVLNPTNPAASGETISSCASACSVNSSSDSTDCCGSGSTLGTCCTFNNAISGLGSSATVILNPTSGSSITFGSEGNPGDTQFGGFGYDWTVQSGTGGTVTIDWNNIDSSGTNLSGRFNSVADTTIASDIAIINTFIVTNGNTLTLKGNSGWSNNQWYFGAYNGSDTTVHFQEGTYGVYSAPMTVTSEAGGATTFIADSNVSITLDGEMNFIGGATFSGPGSFLLGGAVANTGAGEITIGTASSPVLVQIAKDGALGTGAITINNGSTLTAKNSVSSYTLSQNITAPSGSTVYMRVAGGSTLTLSGTNSFYSLECNNGGATGNITLSGTLSADQLLVSGGTFAFTSSTTSSLSNLFANGGTVSIENENALPSTVTVNTRIAGTAIDFSNLPAGSTTLTWDYLTTNVQSGSTPPILDSGSNTITLATFLRANSATDAPYEKKGSGTIIFNDPTSTASGGFIVSEGTLGAVGSTTMSGSTITSGPLGTGPIALQNGTTLSFPTAGSYNLLNLISFTGATTISAASGVTIGVNGVFSGSGSVNFEGPGNIGLGGVSTYSGGTTVGTASQVMTLFLYQDGCLGTGDITISDGSALNINSTVPSYTFSQNVLAPSGSSVWVNIHSGVTTTFSGTGNSFSTFNLNGAGTFELSGQMGAFEVLVKQGKFVITTSNTGGIENLFASGDSTVISIENGSVQLPSMTIFLQGAGSILDFSSLSSGSYTIDLPVLVGNVTSGETSSIINTGSNSITLTSFLDGGTTVPIQKTGSGTLTFNNSSSTFPGGFTVSAGTLGIVGNTTLSGSTITSGPLGTGSIALQDGATFLFETAGTYTIDNPISVSGEASISAVSGANGNLNGILSGSGSVSFLGLGTVTLGGTSPNTISGGVNIGSATETVTLKMSKDGALGTGLITLNNGSTLEATDAITSYTISQNITSTGSAETHFIVATGSTLTLSGDINLSGQLSMWGGEGTIELTGTMTAPSWVVDEGTFIISSGNQSAIQNLYSNGPSAIVSIQNENALATSSTVLLYATGSTLDFSALSSGSYTMDWKELVSNVLSGNTSPIIDTGSNSITISAPPVTQKSGTLVPIQKVGSGTLIFNDTTGTFPGGFTVSEGTLEAVGSTTLSGSTVTQGPLGTGSIALQDGTILSFGGSGSYVFDNPVSFTGATSINTIDTVEELVNGVLSGSGSVNFATPGSIVLGGTSPNTYSGGTTIGSSTQIVTLFLNKANALGTGDITINDGSALRLQVGASSTFSQDIIAPASSSVFLVIEDTSPLTLSGTGNTFSTLILGGSNTTGALTVAGALSADTIEVQGGSLLVASNLSAPLGAATLAMSSGGTLGIGSSASPGIYILNNAITLPGSGSVTFETVADTLLELSTAISGGADLHKTGKGAILLGGTSTYTGKTYVDEGGLIVNGDIVASGDPVVAAGALLSGTGTVGTADVYGTIKGGNPLGTLTITGDLILEDSSSFGTAVTEAELSQVVASGDVTIGSNATYIVIPTPGSYNFAAQVALTGDSITGTFTNIIGNEAYFLDATLGYSATEVTLTLAERKVGTLATGTNAEEVAAAIDSAIAYNRSSVSFTLDPDSGLTAVPPAKLEDVLKSLSPLETEPDMTYALNQIHQVQLKGLAITQENNAVLVRGALSQRMQNEMALSNCRDVYRDKTACPCSKDRKQTTLWVNGIGESFGQDTRTDSRGPLAGYRVNTGGFVLGGDYLFGEYFYAGVLSGYTHSHLNWKSNKGTGDISSGYAGLYLSGQGGIFYGNLSVTGAWSNYKVDRKIDYSDISKVAKSSHGGSQILSHADTGLNFEWLGVTIRPFDSFDYISQTENKYTEKNAGDWNLFVEKNNPIMIRNELGLQVSACYCLPNSTWTVSPKLSWVREVRVKGGNFNVEFAESGDAFTINGYFPNRSLVAPGGAVTGVMMDGSLSFSLYYNGEFATGYSDNKFGGEIRYAF